MQETRQGGWRRRRGLWQLAGAAAAVIAAGGLAYPVVSRMFSALPQESTVAIQAPDPAIDPPSPESSVIGGPNATNPPSAPPGDANLPVALQDDANLPVALQDDANLPVALQAGATRTSAVPRTTTSTSTVPRTTTSTSTVPRTTTSTSTVPRTTTPSALAQENAGSGSASTPLAGRIRLGEIHDGVATFYDSDGSGACSYDRSSDHMTAAMNWKDYEDSKACGAYVEVRGSNGVTITVRITNLCPSPCRVGQLDLDPEAYKLLAPLKTGETPITWKLVSPNISGGMAIRYKTGSSQWWCGIQAINHRNPVARLEVMVGGAWTVLPRADYNYFLSANGSGCGGALRVTDIFGESLVVEPLPVRPDAVQQTGLQFARH